jgi:predicted LPLAT superfamily acyltransferase
MKDSTYWPRLKERGTLWGMRFLLRVYLLFGRTVLQVFLYSVVTYYWLINHSGRRASQSYLSRVAKFSPISKLGGGLLCSYRHFISFAIAIIDNLSAWAGALLLADVEYHGRDQLLAEIKKGCGVILLGSHLGNLEVCRVIAYLDQDIIINVLVHTKHAEKFNRLLNQYNDKSRLNLIQVTEITAATSILLSAKIDNGELIIIAADRTAVGHSQRVAKANFLGD